MIALLLILLLALFALIVWMADGLQTPQTFEPAAIRLEGVTPQTSTTTDQLTVVSWNVAWAYGWGSEGSGSAKEKAHFERTLTAMGKVLHDLNPDVVLLQEVDFDATRSHHIDQAETLARAAGLPHVARAVSWRANWIPFPYWPPKDHFGQMSSGGAILSRYPITKNRVELLEKPSENAWWYNVFYLFRYLQIAEVDVSGRPIAVVNTHLEAFRPKNRQAQATHLAAVLSEQEEERLVFGGDLNSVPPEATTRRAYADEPETDHENDRTVALLRAVDGLFDVVSPGTYSGKESSWFTFPAHEPNRKLDYLFHGRGLEVLESRVIQEAGTASDHLPIFSRLRIRE